jgi:DNA replication regulator DPB11
MKVTHLVANRPEGEKYKHAKQWGLKVVSVEWLMDSIERGMMLDETVYDPSLAPEERGKNAWTRRSMIPGVSLGKRGRPDGGNLADPEAALAGRRKLRRTASTKLQSQNSAIWTDIIGGGFDRKSMAADPAGEERQEANSPATIEPHPERDTVNLPSSTDATSKELAMAAESGLFARRSFYLHGFDAKRVRVAVVVICVCANYHWTE